MTYQNSYSKSYGNRVYSPKKPIRSFEDLEVYQKALSISVGTAKRISDNAGTGTAAHAINRLVETVLELPLQIARAHSLRFGDGLKATQTLEEAMLACNLTVVLLEQYRDLWNTESKIEATFFEEQIKGLLALRAKLLRLQMSWKKFNLEKQND